MPLGQNRDSYLDLKNLAETTTARKSLSDNAPLDTSNIDSWTGGEEHDTGQWWKLGDDISKFERDFVPTRRNQKRETSCCWLGPWLSPPRQMTPEDSDDEDVEEFVHLLEEAEKKQHSSSRSETSAGTRGIVKKSSIVVQISPGVGTTRRSSYRPEFNDHKEPSEREYKRVRFKKPIGKVVGIQPHYTMLPDDRARIWWQDSDFAAFKLELSLLTKSKQLGGSEIWLGDEQKTAEKISDPSKWWHKFGHSRRGLERFLSREQEEVERCKKVALNMVLAEQRKRQPNKQERISKVYMEYTAWSRYLALAAAASDADAVASGFDDSSRKTREYYLVKQVMLSHGECYNSHTPQFMVPVGLSPHKAYREKKQPSESAIADNSKRPSLNKTLSKKAAGYGSSENVGSMISAINATRN